MIAPLKKFLIQMMKPIKKYLLKNLSHLVAIKYISKDQKGKNVLII